MADLDAFEAATPDHGVMAVGKRKRKGDTPSEWTPRIRRTSSQVVTEKDLHVKMLDSFHEDDQTVNLPGSQAPFATPLRNPERSEKTDLMIQDSLPGKKLQVCTMNTLMRIFLPPSLIKVLELYGESSDSNCDIAVYCSWLCKWYQSGRNLLRKRPLAGNAVEQRAQHVERGFYVGQLQSDESARRLLSVLQPLDDRPPCNLHRTLHSNQPAGAAECT